MLKMLWTGEYDHEWEKRFNEIVEVKRAGFNIHNIAKQYFSEDEVIEALQGMDIFFVGYDPITAKVLDHCPDLKLILSVRDGPEENIDLAACEERGIPVLNSAGRCTVSVAELTMQLIANMARPVIDISNEVRAKHWTKANNQMLRNLVETRAFELYRKTLGIVGLGRNGQHLAKIAQGYGMKVIAYDPFLPKCVADKLDVELTGLNELAKTSDYISILARAAKENVHLFGKKQIDLMKPSACLVNTARASLVDYEALKNALIQNKIRMAALDVFSAEPLDCTDFFFEIDSSKLILTSHMAGFCNERSYHQYEIGYENLVNFLEGKAILNNCTKNVENTKSYITKGQKLFGIKKA